MLTENTVNKLQEMKLTAMARAFKEQLNDPNINGLAFEDRFGLLVDQEWTSRKNNHLKRLIKQAKFSETGACVEDIEYHSDRNLDSAQITRLASCNYIAERHNILLLGATGSGKTYLACALGNSFSLVHSKALLYAVTQTFIGISAQSCSASFLLGSVPDSARNSLCFSSPPSVSM